MAKRRKPAETFAEVVAKLPEPGPPYVPSPSGPWQPITLRELQYPQGTHWELSQADPPLPEVARTILRRDLTVLQLTGPMYSEEIPHAHRAAYWAAVSPYLDGTIYREPNDYTFYRVGLFADADETMLLLFQRDCY